MKEFSLLLTAHPVLAAFVLIFTFWLLHDVAAMFFNTIDDIGRKK